MKRLSLGNPLPGEQGFNRWATDALRTIERASAEDIEAILSEFTVTGTVTELRTFDAGTATSTQVRNVLATLINDIKARGQNRAYGS